MRHIGEAIIDLFGDRILIGAIQNGHAPMPIDPYVGEPYLEFFNGLKTRTNYVEQIDCITIFRDKVGREYAYYNFEIMCNLYDDLGYAKTSSFLSILENISQYTEISNEEKLALAEEFGVKL